MFNGELVVHALHKNHIHLKNLVNKKGLPVWKLAYSFSVYIILPENTHQYLFTAADNSPLNIFHSRFAIILIFVENPVKTLLVVEILVKSSGIFWRKI
jgi:hypothetical protein